MTESDSGPETVEVKKRRLRTALRDARAQKGMTQRAAANELVWSVSKIVRIEQGTVPVVPSDVRVMLQLYSITGESRVNELVGLAKEVREGLAKEAREGKGWSTFADILSQESLDLFASEPAAKVIYKYEPSVVPGLFQTQEYARALLRALGNSEEDVDRRLDIRIQRQQLLDSPHRPELHFILGETALARPAGSNEIMREQIAHILELAKLDGITVLVLPLAAGVHRNMGGAFTVLQFEDPQLRDLLYLEGSEGESVSHDEKGKIRRSLELYVELQNMAEKYGSVEENIERILRERYGNYD
jgi:transcriptional regulator with XRE-family HTH domain